MTTRADARSGSRASFPAQCYAAQVNGRTVVRWARFLSGRYMDVVGGLTLSDAALAAYETVRGVPDSLVAASVCAATAEEVQELEKVRPVATILVAAMARARLS